MWISEHPDAGKDALPMDRAIGKLRDEITGFAMLAHNGHDRSLALVMTKLDEARLWARDYHEQHGNYVTVDKRRFAPDTTGETGSHE